MRGIFSIKTATDWGVVDGATTNPTLIAKEGRDFKQTVIEICKIVNGPVSAEVMSTEAGAMVEEAKKLSRWHKHVIIKIPCTPEGLKTAKILEEHKIRTNVTLVFSTNQVLLAAKAGASYISPFVGRLDDAGEDGLAMIAESLRIIENYKFKSQIIAASVRSPLTVQRAAALGAHVATVPFKILEQMFKHPLTDAGIKKFQQDWESVTSSPRA
ncbi:fructose-6-phosphate aldolase [Candidatus Peregrinibacteria bacterium]|nr:fructose-6-phosphate aldolase [Candidatus Peregrinibacteria bacterium]